MSKDAAPLSWEIRNVGSEVTRFEFILVERCELKLMRDAG